MIEQPIKNFIGKENINRFDSNNSLKKTLIKKRRLNRDYGGIESYIFPENKPNFKPCNTQCSILDKSMPKSKILLEKKEDIKNKSLCVMREKIENLLNNSNTLQYSDSFNLSRDLKISDFSIGKILGKGRFGCVNLARFYNIKNYFIFF